VPVTLTQICDATGVTERTVRFYIQQGLLPPPDSHGPKASYPDAALARLQVIRHWQDRHLPLAEIRRLLEGMSEAGIRALADGASAPAGDAAAYAQALLQGRSTAAPVPPPAVRPVSPPRGLWERFQIAPDIEVHVRRPLTKADNRRLDEWLAEAARIFSPPGGGAS
jgi:DNA-binding transcriptional MerR regulator